ncbi:MAG: ABC transporter ATP-binding protein [Candidatus Lokiarchaeota archaeon]|nr:ABC transporter ATP-binding protein [Candidatus Lokiarchaeota archaeon]
MAGKNSIAMEINHLTKIYSEGNVLAVDNISFKVKKGEIFSFLGPNGAGKTTTIQMAATALKITDGTIKIYGYDVEKEREEVRKHIGICPQDLVFYDKLTVLENAMFFGKMYNIPTEKLKTYANELIDKLGLSDKRKTLASKLSGGMKRRLNLIIALVNNPEFLFLDEPTSGLDPQTRHVVWNFIKELKKQGKTIFLTTHYMDEADTLSDTVAIIDHGKIIALDSPFNLKQQYSTGDLVELKFDVSRAMLEEKLQILQQNSEYQESYIVEDEEILRISIRNGLKNIAKLIDALEKQELNIIDMGIRSNSLENVFITLTGRTLRDT